MLKHILSAIAISAAAGTAGAATLLSEGFENVSALTGAGWSLQNLSTPIGTTSWEQGNAALDFPAQTGTPNSYAAANFQNATPGGTIQNWLITPQFSTADATVIAFFARTLIIDPFVDQIAFGVDTAGSTTVADFVLGAAVTLNDEWTEFTLSLAARGAGSVARFGIRYAGLEANSNIAAIDTLTVSSFAAPPEPVPEPSEYALMLAGLGLLGALAGRRTR